MSHHSVINVTQIHHTTTCLLKGAKILARLGLWNGLYLTGYGHHVSEPHPISGFEFVLNYNEYGYGYDVGDPNPISGLEFVLNIMSTGSEPGQCARDIY